ncbi:MAG: glycosyltransferase family 9 protein, partial [Elusimicrobia bacterium]|nr:glycosyltransferase family 9 protein [Elusimicrobiota bacterium]
MTGGPPSPPSRILVVRLSSLGDIVLTTPVLSNLKAAWPGARISFLVKSRFAEVFRGIPAVDEVLTFESLGFRGWLKEIRRRSFDLYVDLHDTPRSRLWGFLSGISSLVRYKKGAWERRMLVW